MSQWVEHLPQHMMLQKGGWSAAYDWGLIKIAPGQSTDTKSAFCSALCVLSFPAVWFWVDQADPGVVCDASALGLQWKVNGPAPS